MPPRTRPCATTLQHSWSRSAGALPPQSPPQFRAATATANSSSEHSVVERLTIAGIGHRGDGVVETEAEPLYVPFTLPGEIVEVETVPGNPDRRHLLRVEQPSPERVAQ